MQVAAGSSRASLGTEHLADKTQMLLQAGGDEVEEGAQFQRLVRAGGVDDLHGVGDLQGEGGGAHTPATALTNPVDQS